MSSETILRVLKNAAALDFGIQGAGFFLAAALRTEKFYDLLGSGSLFLVACKSLQWGHAKYSRQYIQTGMACVWAARLGLFLFTRILKEGKDRRFNQIRSDPKMMFVAWLMQGVWVYTNILPTLIQNGKEADEPIGLMEYVGWAMWVIGFLFEAVADHQKSVFRADPSNVGKFMQSGLWSLSRHPNYFGEILMWLGLYVSAYKCLTGWEHLAVISPLFSAFILTKVSGIPMLEKSGLRRWGDNPAYKQYLAETPILIPSLLKMFR